MASAFAVALGTYRSYPTYNMWQTEKNALKQASRDVFNRCVKAEMLYELRREFTVRGSRKRLLRLLNFFTDTRVRYY
jgi:hypothetical protein